MARIRVVRWRIAAWAAFFLLLVGVAAFWQRHAAPAGTRFQQSGVNSDFRYGELPFAEYVANMRLVIANARVDLKPQSAAHIVEANSPFEFLPAAACRRGRTHRVAKGILLIHGLSDSPYLMRDLGRYFQARCFLVRAILLPGNGTVPGDLLQVRAEAWQQATRYGVQGLAAESDEVLAAGFSAGGALALLAALEGQPLRGTLLFSPALKINSWADFLTPVISRIWPWASIAADEDYAKYESFAVNGASQVYELGRAIRHGPAAPLLTVPMFVALSADDATVDSGETLRYFRSVPNPLNRMLLYGNGPVAEGDPRILRVASARPQERVLQYSHLSVLLSADDPHYGSHGDYRYCLHYERDSKTWTECKTRPDISWGEMRVDHPQGRVFARLMFNPDFNAMTRHMDRFLESIGLLGDPVRAGQR